jgi:MFS family permease
VASTVQESGRPPDAPSARRAGIALAVIVTCQLMVVLDSTVVNIAISQIHTSLHFSTAGLGWVIDAYSLTFGGLLLLGGRAGDIFGRRRMLIAGLVVFTVASLAGGLAVSSAMLNAVFNTSLVYPSPPSYRFSNLATKFNRWDRALLPLLSII